MNIETATSAIISAGGSAPGRLWLGAMVAAGALLLGGCQPSSDAADATTQGSDSQAVDSPNEAADAPSGSQMSNPTQVSPLAARAVVKHYYQDINKGDYQSAYALWWSGEKGGQNASGKTFQQFKAGFAHTRKSQVDIGTPGSIEGAAGSSYIVIPVTIKAITDSGQTQQFTGSYTLRRVNDVDGASWAQKHWHIYSADIQSTQ